MCGVAVWVMTRILTTLQACVIQVSFRCSGADGGEQRAIWVQSCMAGETNPAVGGWGDHLSGCISLSYASSCSTSSKVPGSTKQHHTTQTM